MSFIDPDLREQWAKDSAERKERCRKAGTHAFESTTHLCNVCGLLDPARMEPRVVLMSAGRSVRAVFVPKESKVVIETMSKDSLGAERWTPTHEFGGKMSRSDPNTGLFTTLVELLGSLP